MDRVKRWFSKATMESLAAVDPQPQPSQTSYELTSIKIKQLLEKEQFHKVVDILRELPQDFVLNCLESFPFIPLNRAVPQSFLIWETLLTKLHNSEEGYIPQFPYKACDELVLNIAWLLESSREEELTQSCKRVLKCVYMQYNEVLEHLFKEHDQVEHALYTLGLHSPLGTDTQTPLTIEQAIREEVQACLEDYTTALERLEDFKQEEVLSLADILQEGKKASSPEKGREGGSGTPMDVFAAPSPTQVQLHERLYQYQQVFATLQPTRRRGSLQQLLKLLTQRIHGDKEVISIFARVRDRDALLTDLVPVQPWLRKYQGALDLAIGTLKEIEKELEITIPRVESPMQLCPLGIEVNGVEEAGLQTVPASVYHHRRSYEYERASFYRHSVTVSSLSSDEEKLRNSPPRRNLSMPHTHLSRSISPQKLLRVSGSGGANMLGGGLTVLGGRTGSLKSVCSSEGSSNNLVASRGSSSTHDLTLDVPPSLPFTRVQSLKTHNTVQVAGKKKAILPNSFTNLSATSMGSVNGGQSGVGKKQKKLYKSGSETSMQVVNGIDGMTSDPYLLQKTIECKNKELLAAQKLHQDLRRRERELTDRLSEQAQRHLQASEKFEDILLGSNRPTQVIQRYNELFSQGRMEALDAIEGVVQDLANQNGAKPQQPPSGDFGIQVLLDVLKLSYCEATCALEQFHSKWQGCVGMATDASVAVRQLESAVALYLRRVSSYYDVTDIVQNVRSHLSLKYPQSKVLHEATRTEAFSLYMRECAQVCWDLCVQSPPMLIDSSSPEFHVDLHTRFYESDMNSTTILLYHWPTLMLPPAVPLSRGLVQT